MTADRAHACLVCGYCRYRHFPAPDQDGVQILDAGTGKLCPVCQVEMTAAAVEGIPADHCRKCRGLLIELPAFSRLVATLRARGGRLPSLDGADPKDLERRLDCPVCGQRMDTHVYGGHGNFVIDNCPRCLVNFLDHNEIRRIAVAPEPSTPEPVPPARPPSRRRRKRKEEDASPDILAIVLRRLGFHRAA